MILSIITINYNDANGLKATIDSVNNQTFKDFQYIIIDGGSTDGSVEIIKKNEKNITYWVSEKDSGIYDAMNKGIKFATGEYLIFLNAGDVFYNNNSVEAFSNQHDNCEIVYGNLEVIGESIYTKEYPSKLSFGYFLKDTLPHPGSFMKKSLFDKFGMYKTDMLISADWAFFIKAICLYNVTYKYLPYTVSSFQCNGISSLPENQRIIAEEQSIFLKNNFPLFIDEYLQLEVVKENYNRLKNSRVRKFLSFFFKGLHI